MDVNKFARIDFPYPHMSDAVQFGAKVTTVRDVVQLLDLSHYHPIDPIKPYLQNIDSSKTATAKFYVLDVSKFSSIQKLLKNKVAVVSMTSLIHDYKKITINGSTCQVLFTSPYNEYNLTVLGVDAKVVEQKNSYKASYKTMIELLSKEKVVLKDYQIPFTCENVFVYLFPFLVLVEELLKESTTTPIIVRKPLSPLRLQSSGASDGKLILLLDEVESKYNHQMVSKMDDMDITIDGNYLKHDSKLIPIQKYLSTKFVGDNVKLKLPKTTIKVHYKITSLALMSLSRLTSEMDYEILGNHCYVDINTDMMEDLIKLHPQLILFTYPKNRVINRVVVPDGELAGMMLMSINDCPIWTLDDLRNYFKKYPNEESYKFLYNFPFSYVKIVSSMDLQKNTFNMIEKENLTNVRSKHLQSIGCVMMKQFDKDENMKYIDISYFKRLLVDPKEGEIASLNQLFEMLEVESNITQNELKDRVASIINSFV